VELLEAATPISTAAPHSTASLCKLQGNQIPHKRPDCTA
jgi:hypothetical protein